MKHFSLLFFSLICVLAAAVGCGESQSWDTSVTAGRIPLADYITYGYYPLLKKVSVDGQGNVYLAGSGFNLAGADTKLDWWLRKFNSKGDLKWEKKIDGNGGSDEIRDLAFDADNNVYAVGYGSEIEHDSNPTSYQDWWVREYDPSGTELWDYKNDFQGREDIATSVVIDHGGNIVVGGYYCDTSDDYDYAVMKFDADTRVSGWGANLLHTFDNSTRDKLSDLAVNAADDVYAAGTTYNNSNDDWWIIRINGDDGTLGTQAPLYPGSLALIDEVFAISLTSDDSVYAAGYYSNSNVLSLNYEWALRRYDSSLNEDNINSKLIGNTTSESVAGGDDRGLDLYIDAEDNVYVMGFIAKADGRSYVLKKYDDGGLLQYTKELAFVKSGIIRSYTSFALDGTGNVYLAGNEIYQDGDMVIFNWLIEKNGVE